MAKMLTLTIDGQTVTAPEGMLVVDAAKKIGIDIPVFCYHPKMEPVGMCRMCLVEIGRPAIDRATGQIVKEADGTTRINWGPKLETACTTPVSEGMVVRGMTEKVQAARREVVEFLLTSHPLDCPICDKGGECPLQNLTMAWGPGKGRFLLDEKMRLAKHQPLGELIYLDRERCIQCGRCVRFAHEVAGDPVINFYNRGRKLEIMTCSEPGFDSYFSGDTTDICPVGALTTADFRFEARPWEMKYSASICTQCPVGCNLTLNSRREARSGGQHVVKRVMPRQNENVNEIWICDKGRFAYHFAGSDQRLRQPMIRKDGKLVEASWDEALKLVAGKIQAAGKSQNGGRGLVALAGGRLANEDLFTLRKLAEAASGKTVLDSTMGGGEIVNSAGVGKGTNLGALGKGDAILVAACDLVEEAPVWYLRVKQAAERGAILIVMNPRRTKLEKYASQAVRYNYGEEATALAAMLPGQKTDNELVKAAAEAFATAKNAIVIYGSEGVGLEGSTAVAAAAAQLLKQTGHASKANNGLMAAWQRANDLGAWILGFRPDAGLSETLRTAGIAYIAAADPAGDDPALAQALQETGFVVVQDLFLTATAQLADVVLPAAAFTEREGTFTNGERRVQRFFPAVPVSGNALADFAITAKVLELLGRPLKSSAAASQVFSQLAKEIPQFAGLTYPVISQVEEQWPVIGRQDLYYGGTTYDNHQGLGAQLPTLAEMGKPGSLPGISAASNVTAPEDMLLVVPTTRLYDRGTTVLPSKLLQQRMVGPSLRVHPETAARFGMADGVDARVTINGVTGAACVTLDETVPAGVALLPRSTGFPIDGPVAIKVNQASAISG